MEMPIGYRFKPFDDELVKHYLLATVKGNPMPWNPIIECDLYGENTPGEMFDEASNQKIWYCFTRLKKKGKRVFRTAGGGTWHGQSSGVDILDRENNSKVIGKMKTFSFDMKKIENCRTHCKWNMREFSLVGEYQGCDLVLCEIKKKALEDSRSVSQTCLQEQEDGVLTANTNNNQVQEALQSIDAFLMNDNEEAIQCNGGLLMNDNLPLITDGGIWMNDGVVKASNNSGFSQ